MARYAVTPTMVSPCQQWSLDALKSMEEIQSQIESLNLKLQGLDYAMSGADMAGDYQQMNALESKYEEYSEALDALQRRYDMINRGEE